MDLSRTSERGDGAAKLIRTCGITFFPTRVGNRCKSRHSDREGARLSDRLRLKTTQDL